MTSPFGGRPTLGFMTTRSSNKRKLSEDCCEIARKNHLDQLVKNVNREIEDLKRRDSPESRQYYVELVDATRDHIELVKMSSCVLFRKILEEIAESESEPLFNAQKTLDAWDACENRKYGKDFEDKYASEDTMSWQDTLLKDEDENYDENMRLSKLLYQIVRIEMHADDVHSLDDLYRKVMDRWHEDKKPTKKQVQRILGDILLRKKDPKRYW